MLDAALHTGIEHPNLLWIVVSSLLSFGAGIAVGMYSDDSPQTDGSVADTE